MSTEVKKPKPFIFKLFNKIIKTLISILILIIILLCIFLFSPLLNITTHKSIEHFGSKALNTKVSLIDTNVSLKNSKISLEGFKIKNPQGFSSGNAVDIKQLMIDIDPSTITDDTFIINEIMLDSPTITVQTKGGETNLQALTNGTTTQPKPSEEASKTPTKKQPSKKVLIKKLTLKNSVITLNNNVKIKIPEFTLNNIGNAVSNKNIMQQVLSEIMKIDPNTTIKNLKEQGTKFLNDNLKSLDGSKESLLKQKDLLKSEAKELKEDLKELEDEGKEFLKSFKF